MVNTALVRLEFAQRSHLARGWLFLQRRGKRGSSIHWSENISREGRRETNTTASAWRCQPARSLKNMRLDRVSVA